MEELLARKENLQHLIEAAEDEILKAHLVDELNLVTNQIAEKQYEIDQQQAKEQAIEEKVHAEGVPFAISGVDFTELPKELIEVIELVVKADRRRFFAEHALETEKLEKEIQRRSEESLLDATRIGKLEKELIEWEKLMEEEQKKRHQLEFDLHHAESKRDAAAFQLAEANAEIVRLKDEISDYQKAKVFGEREAQNIIEAQPEDAAAINNAIQRYVSFTNYGTINKVVKADGSTELVKTADLNANWIPESEVTGQDSFRGENTPAITQDSGIPDTETLTPPPFPSEVSDMDNAVGGVAANAALETVTRAEFEALKERVSQLEIVRVAV